MFAPPEGHVGEDADKTLSSEEEDDTSQGPATGPSRRGDLAHILNDIVAGPSSSIQVQAGPSKERKPFDPVRDLHRDDELRATLGLPPYVDPSTEMVDDTLDEASITSRATPSAAVPDGRPLISEYQCPICFSPPSHACLTQCGHVMCATCLFSSVRAARERHVRLYGRGVGPDGEGKVSRCPVCRAVMKGWDGKGNGVIGLKLEMKRKNERTDVLMPF